MTPAKTGDNRKPWEQMDGEPDAAYARFLEYRNLGPGRSLAKANATKRDKTRRSVNGQWAADSAKYNWVERANAWDIENLTQVGQRVVVLYVNALDAAFTHILDALHDGTVKPRSWDQTIESLTILGGFIPQETVANIRQDFADAAAPAIGANAAATTSAKAD